MKPKKLLDQLKRENMDAIERNKETARRFLAGMGGDFARVIAETCAEDCRFTTMGTTPISGERGKAEAMAAAAGVESLFPGGMRIAIHNITAEDDRVAIEAESFATHVSGRPYHNHYHFFMRFRDGKLTVFKGYLDTELAASFFGG
jgi:ketosteroid isomerase-like protein